MSPPSLRSFIRSKNYGLDVAIGTNMAWSAHGSLRTWIVQSSLNWAPISTAAKAVFEAGFIYDPSQDIILSRTDAWQYGFGYCYAYDAFALLAGFVFDCEPIFFHYKNKEWMIELWKGQYGIETGCEFGIYNRCDKDTSAELLLLDKTIGSRKGDNGKYDPFHSKFYKCAEQDEFMKIAFTLYLNGKELFSRGPENHWWLTGFKWGIASRPEDLSMKVSIRLLDQEMVQAFTSSVTQMGYSDISINDTTVQFTFDKPHSFQPRIEYGAFQNTVFAVDSNSVSAYCDLGLKTNDPNLIDERMGDGVLELLSSWMLKKKWHDSQFAYIESLAEQVNKNICEKLEDFFGIRR